MSSPGAFVRLEVQLDLGAGADARDLDAAALQLRGELRELDVADVRRPEGGAVPDGARSAEATLAGALLVTASAGTLPAIVSAIATWLRRRPERAVTLRIGDESIQVTGVSADTQRELIDAFLARNGPR